MGRVAGPSNDVAVIHKGDMIRAAPVWRRVRSLEHPHEIAQPELHAAPAAVLDLGTDASSIRKGAVDAARRLLSNCGVKP